jgi:hypothetical protein
VPSRIFTLASLRHAAAQQVMLPPLRVSKYPDQHSAGLRHRGAGGDIIEQHPSGRGGADILPGIGAGLKQVRRAVAEPDGERKTRTSSGQSEADRYHS